MIENRVITKEYMEKLNKTVMFCFSSVQFSHSVMSNSLQAHRLQHARPHCPSPTPGFTQTHVCWVSDTIKPSLPVSSPSPPAFNLSQHQGLFSNESVLHTRWPKYWSFSPSNEYSGLISFRMDWLDVLPVQGTLKSFLQHRNSKISILWCSAFFAFFVFFFTFFIFFTFTSFNFFTFFTSAHCVDHYCSTELDYALDVFAFLCTV